MRKSIFLISFFCLCLVTLSAETLPKYKIYEALNDSTQLSNIMGEKELVYLPVLRENYQEMNFLSVWESNAQIDSFINELLLLPAYGIDTTGYNIMSLWELNQSHQWKDRLHLEIILSHTYLDMYALHLNGQIGANKRGQKFHLPNLPFDTLSAVCELFWDKNWKACWNEVNNYQVPILKEYAIRYYKAWQNGGWDSISYQPDSLFLEGKDSSILSLNKRLYAGGELKSQRRSRSLAFDSISQIALEEFQYRNHLDSTGMLDTATVDALNRNPKEDWQKIIATLERWRWLPKDLGNYYVEANLPSFLLSVYRDKQPAVIKKIVVGRPTRSTPLFYNRMKYMDINPTWTVPPTILREDIVPKASGNPSYLARKNIVVYSKSTGKQVKHSDIDWSRASSYKYVQAPSAYNSLGIVKFVFPNKYYIFFHDTPTKSHFKKDYRAYSSGCLRVENPQELSRYILGLQDYTPAKVDSIFETGKTKRIILDEKPMVYVNYHTASVDTAGLLFLHQDIYKYDKALLKAINAPLD